MISARALGKRFAETQALADVTLDIGRGEFVALLGPSGCGKSTFLRMLAGLEVPSSGSLTLDGKPVIGPPERLGIALQRDALLDWRSVLDNVLLPADLRGGRTPALVARARELLNLTGLSDFTGSWPAELSGGMRQRAAICRALLEDPPLLLMDEPFGALDAITRDQLNLDLHRLWVERRMTTLFVTHSITEALFLATRVIVFAPRPGRVLEQIEVDLPLPRHLSVREEPQFIALSRHLRATFESMGLLRDAA
ncbi:ABC transporter ATP-binding protein [Humitalea sp. 24SJ18S-53]|uniref:ABC transporter ATP-binding protein n=1 Tax=Humitalea sp. 24SJ18S-53 TaxID=3422307 RepID=UPI003D673549